MSSDNHIEPHEYPAGLKENHGPKVHGFLKLTYITVTIFAIVYLIMYFSGDGSALVEQFNKALQ